MSAEIPYRVHRIGRSMKSYDRLIAHGDLEGAVFRRQIENRCGPSPVKQVLGRLSLARNVLLSARDPMYEYLFRSGPLSLVPNYSSGIDFVPDDTTSELLGEEITPEMALVFHLNGGGINDANAALPALARKVKEREAQELFPVLLAVSYEPLIQLPIRKGMREVEIDLSETAQRRFQIVHEAVQAMRPRTTPSTLTIGGAAVTTREFIDEYTS